MIVRNVDKEKISNRRVESPCGNWESIRLILEEDGADFSFHLTTIKKGAELYMHYQNHLESVYCIDGEGSLLDISLNTEHKIEPGVIYLLDKNDRHLLKANTNLSLACVFSPALKGDEIHDENGSYELR